MCHKFAERWTLEDHEQWFAEHGQEVVEDVMRKLAETRKTVSSETINSVPAGPRHGRVAAADRDIGLTFPAPSRAVPIKMHVTIIHITLSLPIKHA